MAAITASELLQQTEHVLERVKNGESIAITEHGRPVARLIPFQSRNPPERRSSTR